MPLTDVYEVNHPNETFFNMSGPAHCGNRLENDDYRFWLDGILVAVVGTAGFVGNLVLVLLYPFLFVIKDKKARLVVPGNTKGGRIIEPLTCLIGLD